MEVLGNPIQKLYKKLKLLEEALKKQFNHKKENERMIELKKSIEEYQKAMMMGQANGAILHIESQNRKELNVLLRQEKLN